MTDWTGQQPGQDFRLQDSRDSTAETIQQGQDCSAAQRDRTAGRTGRPGVQSTLYNEQFKKRVTGTDMINGLLKYEGMEPKLLNAWLKNKRLEPKIVGWLLKKWGVGTDNDRLKNEGLAGIDMATDHIKNEGLVQLLSNVWLTLIPTAVTIYGSHYFKAKFLKKSLNNINLKK
jgi:hypothetical protein